MHKHNGSILMHVLTRAISIKRPHGGVGVWKLECEIDALFGREVKRDKIGNLHIDRRLSPEHRTLFVAHLDTVHRADGPNRVDWSEKGWAKATKGEPLGADDGAGVALLCHLLDARVPGYYVFTQCEERGGLGAKFLAKNTALLSGFDRAIAFDRRDVFSVISHQGWGRCCSDEFAEALAGRLCDAHDDLIYAPDDTGVYTDTAEFVDLIPECTNISVGYYDEHSDRERLDLRHFKALAKAAAKLRWDALPTKRDPKAAAATDAAEIAWWDTYAVPTKRKAKGKKGKAAGSVRLFEAVTAEPKFTRADYDMLDALEAAEDGNNFQIARILADTMLGEDSDLVERVIRRTKFDNVMFDEAYDNIERYGASLAADILLEKIVRRQT
jgi:hypothetical protein